MTALPRITPERLEIFTIGLPLQRHPQTDANLSDKRSLALLKITDKDGVCGWGEITASDAPITHPDFLVAAIVTIEQIMWPLLCQKAPFDSPEAFDDTLAALRGHPAAKAALSVAAYDIAAQKLNTPLINLIGAQAKPVTVCRALTVSSLLPTLIDQAEKLARESWQTTKLTITPGADLAPALALRRALPQTDLLINAQASYVPNAETMRLFYALDALDLMGIEQPFDADDLVDHARLQAALRTPLWLGESIHNLHSLNQAHTLHSARHWAVKFQRIGSLTTTLRLIRAAQSMGWGLSVGSVAGGPLAFAVTLALAQHPAMSAPADFLDNVLPLKDFESFWRDPPFNIAAGQVYPIKSRPSLAELIDLTRLLPRQKPVRSYKKAA